MKTTAIAFLLTVLTTIVSADSAAGQTTRQKVVGENNVTIGTVGGNVVIYGSAHDTTPLNSSDGTVTLGRKKTVYLNSQVSVSAGTIQGDKVWMTVKVTGRGSKSGYLRPTERLFFTYRGDQPNYAVQLDKVVPEDGLATIRVVPLR